MTMTATSAPPCLSIVLPTYNRAGFLNEAFASIRAQHFSDWELIVVDDGSVDETAELVADLRQSIAQPVHYIYQDNQGAYGARNTGLNHAQGRYIAFFDSDDLWMPHHLDDCVRALEANPDVDWVYGAGRKLDHATGQIVNPKSFLVHGQPRPFLRLAVDPRGPLHVFDDPGTLRCMVLHGLYCGLQNSVFRGSVFAERRFRTHFRNEAEDQLFVVRALAEGLRIGYLDQIHITYRIHQSNSSAASTESSVVKRIGVFEALARGYEEVRDELPLSPAERRAIDQRLSSVYFWVLGYTLLWPHRRRREALAMCRRGLRLWPWDLAYWKTYIHLQLRSLVPA